MKTKLIKIRVYNSGAYCTVKKSINDLNIEVINETIIGNEKKDILTKMTHEQAIDMLNITNNTDALMIKGEA